MDIILDFIKSDFWIFLLIVVMLIFRPYRGWGIILVALQITPFGKNVFVVVIIALLAACVDEYSSKHDKKTSSPPLKDPDYQPTPPKTPYGK